MELIKQNGKIVTREQAYQLVNNDWAIAREELNRFSKRFSKDRQLIISRQKGLGDSLIERTGRKYIIYDITIQ